MRQSVAASRASHATTSNAQFNSAAAHAKLLEKKKEFDAVSALERASSLYLERIEGLAEDCEVMADAGQIHGQVLEQWPRMFQILSLFLNSRNSSDSESRAEEPSTTDQPDGHRLVRIPIEELQEAATERQSQ